MNKEKALEFTNERIENISKTVYDNEMEIKIAKETLEYLIFIKGILEREN